MALLHCKYDLWPALFHINTTSPAVELLKGVDLYYNMVAEPLLIKTSIFYWLSL
jgi:hypothetical protein